MYYSLRNKNKQRNYRKRSVLFLFMTIITVLLFSILGIKILVNIINLITDIKISDQSNPSYDNIPPRIPYIYSLPRHTSSSAIDIKGETESGSIVTLQTNHGKTDVVAGSTGSFLFKVDLTEGDNKFYFYSTDSSGNSSSKTIEYNVILDKTPPDIEISLPQDNTIFYGTENMTVEIKGVSDSTSTVTINDRYVGLADDGSFIFKYRLNTGENILTIKSTDPAGNISEKKITLFFEE